MTTKHCEGGRALPGLLSFYCVGVDIGPVNPFSFRSVLLMNSIKSSEMNGSNSAMYTDP